MKAVWVILIVCSLAVASCQRVAAMKQVYLPIVAQDQTSSVYRLEQIRLWDLYENGGAPTTPITCGHGGRVQVHVFDRRGDVGAAARLNGVTVQVVQYDNGERTVQYSVTQANAAGGGVAEFTIQGWAYVSLVSDVDGQAIASPSATVSANLNDLTAAQLQNALYCTNASLCAALMASNACAGQMSWSVVFVRTF